MLSQNAVTALNCLKVDRLASSVKRVHISSFRCSTDRKALGWKVDQKQETQIHTKPLLNSKHITQPWNLALQTDLGVEDFQVRQLTLNCEEKLSNPSYKGTYAFPQ